MSEQTVGFLNWRTERREAAKTREANYGEGEDDDINRGCVEFELFPGPQRESLPFVHLTNID